MMDYVKVSFRMSADRCLDLMVPAFVTVAELLAMLSEAFGIPLGQDNRLQAEPLGRILTMDATLEQEDVRHGALLTLI